MALIKLRKRHRLRCEPDDFTIQNQTTLLKTERETSRSMTLLVGGAAGISLNRRSKIEAYRHLSRNL